MRCGAVRCGAVRCGAVRCGAMRRGCTAVALVRPRWARHETAEPTRAVRVRSAGSSGVGAGAHRAAKCGAMVILRLCVRRLNGFSERCANHHMARAVVNCLCTELRAKVRSMFVHCTALAPAAARPSVQPALYFVAVQLPTTEPSKYAPVFSLLRVVSDARKEKPAPTHAPTHALQCVACDRTGARPGLPALRRHCLWRHSAAAAHPAACCGRRAALGLCRAAVRRRVLAYAQVFGFCQADGHDLRADAVRRSHRTAHRPAAYRPCQ